MREYEIVYIFRSNLTAEEVEAKLERYHELITAEGRGEITALEQWGKRQLAYPILREKNGYYVVVQCTADAEVLPALERALKLDDDILRYLVVLSEGELPVPQSMHDDRDDGRRKSRDEDDEDGDDEDDDEDDADEDDDDEGDDEDEDEDNEDSEDGDDGEVEEDAAADDEDESTEKED